MFSSIFSYFSKPPKQEEPQKDILELIHAESNTTINPESDTYTANSGEVYTIKVSNTKSIKSVKVSEAILIGYTNNDNLLNVTVMTYFWTCNDKEINKLFMNHNSNNVKILIEFLDNTKREIIFNFVNNQTDEEKEKKNAQTKKYYFLNLNIMALNRDLSDEMYKEYWNDMTTKKVYFEQQFTDINTRENDAYEIVDVVQVEA